ncbi:MAG: phenylacetate--CoA ligase family protein [Anaerolineae bacterium]
MIWNEEMETMPREKMQKLQLERLKELVARVSRTVPFYQKAFAEAGVSADDIKSLEDLNKLPFTTKDDFRATYPFGLFAVPLKDVVRLHASSGTTGKMVVGGYTRADLELWGEVMARTLTLGGVTKEDIVHNAYGYGLFTGGLGIQIGAEKIGATVIPLGGGMTKRQLTLMEDFGATVLTCTPSYALVLAEEAKEMGINFKERMKLRVGFFGAEPWSERIREEIEEKLGLMALDIYGLTEIIGPGVANECPHKNGLHIFEDHFLPEIIDPDTGEPLGYGQEGELVITTLTKEALPVIRYRTRDRTTLYAEPCPCGRTQVRMAKVLGRTDDMLIVRGVNLFPSQIERVLLEIDKVEPHYQILIDRPRDQLDKIEIWVEASEELFKPVDTRRLEELENKIRYEMKNSLGITVDVKLMGPKTIERSMGKSKRVVDRREI